MLVLGGLAVWRVDQVVEEPVADVDPLEDALEVPDVEVPDVV